MNVPKKPINILYFSSFAHLAGGGQISLMLMAAGLDKRAFTPHVAVPAKGTLEARLTQMQIPVFIVPLPPVSLLRPLELVRAAYRVAILGRRLGIDIFHTDGPRNTFYAGMASVFCGAKVVWHIRAEAADPFDRLLSCFTDRIVLVADALRKRFDRLRQSGKMVTVHNGILLSEFSRSQPAEPIRTVKKEVVIGTVGRIERIKGQDVLLEAFGRLKCRHPHIRLLLAGGISEPDFEADCRKIIDRHGLKDCVDFLGHQEDVASFLSRLDIFVLPSLSEAFPRALLEAMAAGKAVIATDVGGCAEAVVAGVSGLLAPAKDAAALAEKIEELIEDDVLRKQMGVAARRRIQEEFTMEGNVRRMEQIYRSLLSYPGRRIFRRRWRKPPEPLIQAGNGESDGKKRMKSVG